MQGLSDLVFLPRPRTIRDAGGVFTPGEGVSIAIQGDSASLVPIAGRVQAAIRESWRMECPVAAAAASEGNPWFLLAIAPGHPAEGYRLSISPPRVLLEASEPAGLFHGTQTVAQALRQCGSTLPAGEIVDSPDFPNRGVMLDISRDKVPTMETLLSLVDIFSELKYNHLELYTEHTFAYSGHREVWAASSPMTGDEIRRLDAYCRERFVELVPNQNSFGHLHRWLSLPRYRHLAECPDGFDWPWGGRSSSPFSLDPADPGSAALLEELFSELLPHFGSRLFNVGCDETFDLGQGKSQELCARRGKGRVYLDFLLKIHEMVRRRGRTMLFWGDIIMEHPELVAELPRDSVALEWGYEAQHPFAEHGARFAGSGIPFWVCPGTSSWNSLAGRTDNCLGNLRAAAEGGLANGAAGCLVTDWGDNGHWQALPVSFLGFSAGAAQSWCAAANRDLDLAGALDAHVFKDRARVMGRLAHDLGNAYLRAGRLMHNESLLNHILRNPDGSGLPGAGLPGAGLPGAVSEAQLEETRAYVEAAASRLSSARMDRPDAGLVVEEYENTVRLLLHACDRGIAALRGTLADPRTTRSWRGELEAVLSEYRRIWLRRNRIGGLEDSIRGLESLLPEGPQT